MLKIMMLVLFCHSIYASELIQEGEALSVSEGRTMKQSNVNRYKALATEIRDVASSNLTHGHKKRLLSEKISSARLELNKQRNVTTWMFEKSFSRKLKRLERFNQQGRYKQIEVIAEDAIKSLNNVKI